MIAVLLVLAAGMGELPTEVQGEAGFVALFDGHTLDGWRKVGGGASYRVEDGCVVGTVGPGPNTFLRTEKTFSDFILKVEFKLDVNGNSGIQFRSHQRDQEGRVYGYQCEIDPTPRAYTGGIYDEGRRGWLFPLKDHPEAQAAYRANEWNEFVIYALGPRLRTYLNGVAAADLWDSADLEGFLALQVHSGKQGVIRWRNIRLKDLGTSAFEPLWNGTNFTGWDQLGQGQWEIVDGKIRGTATADQTEFGHLITQKQFTDFMVRVRYLSQTGNSGLYFRVEPGGPLGVRGFQAEIDPDKDAGGLYETDGRAWVVQPSAAQVAKYYKKQQPNDMTVIAIGQNVWVFVNDTLSAKLTNDPGRTKGHIALQVHNKQEVQVEFHEVELLDLTGAKYDSLRQ